MEEAEALLELPDGLGVALALQVVQRVRRKADLARCSETSTPLTLPSTTWCSGEFAKPPNPARTKRPSEAGAVSSSKVPSPLPPAPAPPTCPRLRSSPPLATQPPPPGQAVEGGRTAPARVRHRAHRGQ